MQVDYARDTLLTDFSKATLKDRYLLPDESYQDLFARVAKTYGNNDAHAQRLYDYISKLWFMPATPVLSNGGTTRGLPISCFLSEADDDMEGIVSTWNENTWLASKGGGVGSYWGNIRSLNEPIGKVGKSSGVVPFLKVQDSLTLAISQGSLRRGSSAIFLPVHHPEIEEFIEIRRPTGDSNRRTLNLHHGVVIDDKFMMAVLNDDDYELLSPKDHTTVRKVVKARDLWQRLLTARLETGEPYMVFVDNINKAIPQHHKDLGLKVKMSNLCVAPETEILTDQGYKTISSLENEEINVWNGEEFSPVTVVKTGVNQKLLKVIFNDGSFLECTPEHDFYIQTTSRKVVKIKAENLTEGMKLEKWELPKAIENTFVEVSNVDMYTQGFYSGDGNTNLSHSWVYKPKYACLDRLIGVVGKEHSSSERVTLNHGKMLDKHFIPFAHSIKDRINWLAGLLDADGCVIQSTHCDNVQLSSVESNFLYRVKLFLQELGVYSSVITRRAEGEYLLPKNDGSGELKNYQCKTGYALNINGQGVKTLMDLGLVCERLKFRDIQAPQRAATKFITVKEVIQTNRVSDTFCFTEHKRNRGMFNGVVTGQCVEITLPTGKDHHGVNRTAVCCLSSLNLEKYDEWKDDPIFIRDIMYFLDNVLQDFIDQAPDTHAKARYAAMRERSVGLGVMGLHYAYQARGFAFGSPEAYKLNKEIFSHIKQHCDAANKHIAGERGPCPDAADAGYPHVRFSNCTAIAPTASISVICGGSSPGVEPVIANTYTHKTLSGNFTVKNPHLVTLLESLGKNDEDTWRQIKLDEGSVQSLSFLTDQQKAVFLTFKELEQMDIIRQAASRQPYIDQSQSINLCIPANVSKRYLNLLHMEAWKLGVKTLYYTRSESVQRAEKPKVDKPTSNCVDGVCELVMTPPVNDECLACQ